MGFRAFLVMDNTIARQAMAENGGKWQKMVEKSSPRLFGRNWSSRATCAIPLLLTISLKANSEQPGCYMIVFDPLMPKNFKSITDIVS